MKISQIIKIFCHQIFFHSLWCGGYHHCKIIYLHNFGLIFTADLIKIDKVHFFSHFYIMATKNLNCCLFIKNVFCCWPVSTLHVNRDFPLELFVVHWTTDVLHWLISHIWLSSNLWWPTPVPQCRWWVSVGVFSRIHPWHYQVSQVHGCHVIVSWHRTKNILTVTAEI